MTNQSWEIPRIFFVKNLKVESFMRKYCNVI